MIHVRQQIRNAAATLLTGLPITGARVFKNRIRPLADNQLPALIIRTDDEDVQRLNISPDPALERSLQLVVVAKAKASDELDDQLDSIIAEVENALSASIEANTLGGLVKEVALTGIVVGIDGAGERPIGQAEMTFAAMYYTQASAPDVSI